MGDAGEARHSFEFPNGVTGLQITDDVANRLFDGNPYGLGGVGSIDVIPGGFVNFVQSNAYIFCVTVESHAATATLQTARSFDPQYDSAWAILDLVGFGDAVRRAVSSSFTRTSLTDDALESLNAVPEEARGFTIEMLHGQVVYLADRRHYYSSPEDILKLPSLQESRLQSLFRKNVRDSHQFEYRFVFMPHHPTLGQLEVKDDAIFVPVAELMGSIDKVDCPKQPW